MASALTLQSAKRLGDELLASKAHINNAALLLSSLSTALDSSSATPVEVLLQSLHSLYSFFASMLSSGGLSLKAFEEAKERLQNNDDTSENAASASASKAQAIYLTWVWDKYNSFQEILLQILSTPSVSVPLHVAAVDALMEFVRNENPGCFSNHVYEKVCSALVLCRDFDAKMIEHLITKYFKFIDVCCHTCNNLRKIVINYQKRTQQDHSEIPNDKSSEAASLGSVMCNACDILFSLNSPSKTSKDSNLSFESWSKTKGVGVINDSETKSDSSVSDNKVDVKKLRSKITKTWLALLRLPLSGQVYEKVLAQIHRSIIPNLTNPILLSDFLTNSYNKGGLISVMALSGLFSLITEYGLEYPEFYAKLYSLLEPSMFMAKYRARFFELLDACLKSPLLPSYLAASFAKKLGRIALMSPPAGALVVIALVHNLLRRHPSINFLVHQSHGDSVLPVGEDEAKNGEHKEDITGEQKHQQAGEKPGKDPFNISEFDPAKSNALKSSLWEMDTIRRHYCPAVSRFVASLETDLTVRAKTTELNIKDFSSGSYATFFSEEVKKRMKQVPLAFYKSTPISLFSSPLQDNPAEVLEFPGWRFGNNLNNSCNHISKQNSSPEDLAQCVIDESARRHGSMEEDRNEKKSHCIENGSVSSAQKQKNACRKRSGHENIENKGYRVTHHTEKRRKMKKNKHS